MKPLQRPHNTPSPEYQACSNCGVDKPLDDYARGRWGNVMPKCRDCVQAHKKESLKRYRQANRTKIKAYIDDWKQRNPNHRERYREYDQEYGKRWAAENRERIREREQSPKTRAHRAAYREANRARQNKKAKERFQNDPSYRERVYHNKRRYYARKAKAEGSITLDEWRSLKRLWKHRCAYCGKKPKVLTQDHVVALSKGGRDDVTNIVPACKSCNCGKGNRPPPKPVQLHMLSESRSKYTGRI